MPVSYEFFLGGHDLEMATIARLLHERSAVVHDHSLTWSNATASSYRDEIHKARAREAICILVELRDDLGLAAEVARGTVILVDHHGDGAGIDQPTSLEQVVRLLELPSQNWTRELSLIAANDRGHIAGMKAIDATQAEMLRIRAEDRQAQGIGERDEAKGRDAASRAKSLYGGRVKIVELPHEKTATVTDVMEKELGGPGFENLIILSPQQTMFYGTGKCIDRLKWEYPEGWWGGELPLRGYWGIGRKIGESTMIQTIEPCLKKPAAEIKVTRFHHTLFWPVIMRGPSPEDSSIEPFVDAFTEVGWEEQEGPEGGVHSDFSYEEIVYFHPFVRDFLFGDGKARAKERTLRRFTRKDLRSVDVEIDPGADSATAIFRTMFRLERAELLLIRPRIAIFMIEVSNRCLGDTDKRTPLFLDQVLFLQSRFRHLYPPYFPNEGTHGDCPTAVKWNGVMTSPVQSSASDHKEFRDSVIPGAEPPVYAHWRVLFEKYALPPKIKPLRSANDRDGGGLFLQQLLDDRMPGMSLIVVDDPFSIAQDDEDRMPAFDPPGLDYEPEFRNKHRDEFRYTRFRHWGTTYYCNGTSFAIVTGEGDHTNFLQTHFQRHYTHLAVIAQYQHAALLYFADELADIAKDMSIKNNLEDPDSQGGWRQRLRDVQHRFLKFRTRSYFTEVSNQIQGKDLFRFWTVQLGTVELFERVSQTNREVYDAVENDEIKVLTRQQKHLSDIATVGLIVSLTLAILNIVLDWVGLFPDPIKQQFPEALLPPFRGPWFWLFIACLISLFFACRMFKGKFRRSLDVVNQFLREGSDSTR
jgi:hypothetical protein